MPDTEQGKQELSKEIAASHAHTVLTLINKTPLSIKEKGLLLEQTAGEANSSTQAKTKH